MSGILGPRYSLPPPPAGHDRYLAAETVRDTYETVDMVYVNSNKLVPGDTVTDFTRAWENPRPEGPRQQIRGHIDALLNVSLSPTDDHFVQEGLTGEVGALKRNTIKRFRDEAYRLLKPDKDNLIDLNLITAKERKLGLEVLGEYFEAAATYLKSIFPAASAAVEFLTFTKQACKAAAKWL